MPQTMSPFKYQLKVCACEVEFHKPHCYKQRGNVANRGGGRDAEVIIVLC